MESPDGLPTPRRYWSVLTIGLAITMAVLDSTIANVALPAIARDLKVSEADSIWVVNAYQIAVTVSLLPLAALGDRIGYRLIYQAGLVTFTFASLACAMSHSISGLALARVFQGLGAAGIMGMNGALTRFTYPNRLLGRGFGINAAIVASASALGPTVASAILAAGSWRWLFGVNVPLGVVTVVVAGFALPSSQRSPHRFDVASAVLSAGSFGLLIYGLEAFSRGLLAPGVSEVVLGVAAGWVALRRAEHSPAPLVPVDLFRIPSFAMAAATSVCSFVAQATALLSMPFLMQGGLGRTAVQTGLLMTPWPLATVVAGPIAGRLADRIPVGLLCGVGLAVMAVGMACLAGLPDKAADLDIIWRMVLCGAGFAFFQTPNNRSMMAAAPRERAGAAGGMMATQRLVGQTLGALGLAMLFRVDPVQATRIGLGAAAVMSVAAAVISSLRLRRLQA
jgi:DHA2 family multidrug resistance protein-like MFS transporter